MQRHAFAFDALLDNQRMPVKIFIVFKTVARQAIAELLILLAGIMGWQWERGVLDVKR
jgi:hypothetical protein